MTKRDRTAYKGNLSAFGIGVTGLVLIFAYGTLAFWFFGFVLCLVGGITFVIAGIMIAIYRKTSAISKLRKPKCISALCIIIGAMLIPFSFGILFPFLDFIRETDFSNGYDFLNKSLGTLESTGEIFVPIFKLTSDIVFGFFVAGILAVTVLFWVKGIRTAIKLKSIDDVDTYNKKLKLSFLLIFLGIVGTGSLILLLRALMPY